MQVPSLHFAKGLNSWSACTKPLAINDTATLVSAGAAGGGALHDTLVSAGAGGGGGALHDTLQPHTCRDMT